MGYGRSVCIPLIPTVLRTENGTLSKLKFDLLNHTASLHNSESELTRITFQYSLLFSNSQALTAVYALYVMLYETVQQCIKRRNNQNCLFQSDTIMGLNIRKIVASFFLYKKKVC